MRQGRAAGPGDRGSAPEVLSVVPAAPMPMATQARILRRHGNDVAHAGRYVSVASGAQIGLRGLIGLEKSGLGIG